VQDEKVGSSVLQTPLKRRVLIIPLTKIQRSHLSPEVRRWPARTAACMRHVDSARLHAPLTARTGWQAIAKAKSLAPGRVDVALSLVGYPAEVEAAMDFVFGSTMICKGAAALSAVEPAAARH